MKRALAQTLLLAIIVSLVAGINAVEVAEANFVPSGPHIIIDSPEENMTYETSSVWLNITLRAFYDSDSWNVSRVAEFSLDGEGNITVPVVYEGLDEDGFSNVTGSFLLSDLSDGSHSMTVYATYHYIDPWNLFYSYSKPVNFTIDLPEPIPTPEPTIEPESFPTSLVIASSIPVTVFAVFLFYMRKHKH